MKEWEELKAVIHYEFIDRRGWLFFAGMWVGILVGAVAVIWNP